MLLHGSVLHSIYDYWFIMIYYFHRNKEWIRSHMFSAIRTNWRAWHCPGPLSQPGLPLTGHLLAHKLSSKYRQGSRHSPGCLMTWPWPTLTRIDSTHLKSWPWPWAGPPIPAASGFAVQNCQAWQSAPAPSSFTSTLPGALQLHWPLFSSHLRAIAHAELSAWNALPLLIFCDHLSGLGANATSSERPSVMTVVNVRPLSPSPIAHRLPFCYDPVMTNGGAVFVNVSIFSLFLLAPWGQIFALFLGTI